MESERIRGTEAAFFSEIEGATNVGKVQHATGSKRVAGLRSLNIRL